MLPSDLFLKQPKSFWAHVRSISQTVGYTERGTGRIKIPTIEQIVQALERLGLRTDHVARGTKPTKFGSLLLGYFAHRADVLNDFARPRLMDGSDAAALFNDLRTKYAPSCPLPMNKQSGEKRTFAYLTGIVNTLIEANCEGSTCDYDPRALTTVTRDGVPVRTLARRVDGAFPSAINPIAVWEIKEYYYTRTFGSRVADGVYETLVDGIELEELRQEEGIHVLHYLIVDSHFTWWECGRSYLCRIVDMLHMGYIDEVLFGREVVERIPIIVRNWLGALEQRKS